MPDKKALKNLTPAELEARAGLNISKLKAEFDKEQAANKQAIVSIIPKFMRAPIILASTHGAYDLRSEPKLWTVPANTYIFETQSIGDTTLTTIDDPIWRLCQSASRPHFINYFLGNEDFFKIPENGPAQEQYSKIFKNLNFYKPGDTIAERDLSIGGGRKAEPDGLARSSYVNMGFYKFNMGPHAHSKPPLPPPRTPSQDPPVPSKERRVSSEILHAMRSNMVEDDDFSITNRQFVELMVPNAKGETVKIAYKGKRGNGKVWLKEPAVYSFPIEKEKYRIFIFSSCAVPNCNSLTDETGKVMDKPYESTLCNRRIKMIEAIQATQGLKLLAMGIHTGPGGYIQQGVTNKKLGAEAKNLRTAAKGKAAFGAFALGDDEEEYAMLNDDVANWWELVDETPEEKAKSPVKTKPFETIEKRNATAKQSRGGLRRRKTRSNRQRKRW